MSESTNDMELEVGSEEKADSIDKAAKAMHNKFLEMIITFLKMDHKRLGTASSVAIKKYLGLFGVNVRDNRLYINECLKKAVKDGILEQVSGKGASGTFKLLKSKGLKTRRVAVKLSTAPDMQYFS